MRRLSGNGYEIHYEGGRLADVVIDGQAIECVQVADYDWQAGKVKRRPTDAQIRKAVREFLNEAGGIQLYIDNVVRYS